MSGEFPMVRGDASKLFEQTEEAFHEGARLVAVSIIVLWCVAIRARLRKLAVVLGGDLAVARLAGKNILDSCPLGIP
jgi:hypothetical protein